MGDDDQGIRGWACLSCHHVDGSYSSKDIDRMQIEIDTQVFLAEGKAIETVDHTANHSFKQPVKRSRSEQIRYVRVLRKISGS